MPNLHYHRPKQMQSDRFGRPMGGPPRYKQITNARAVRYAGLSQPVTFPESYDGFERDKTREVQNRGEKASEGTFDLSTGGIFLCAADWDDFDERSGSTYGKLTGKSSFAAMFGSYRKTFSFSRSISARGVFMFFCQADHVAGSHAVRFHKTGREMLPLAAAFSLMKQMRGGANWEEDFMQGNFFNAQQEDNSPVNEDIDTDYY